MQMENEDDLVISPAIFLLTRSVYLLLKKKAHQIDLCALSRFIVCLNDLQDTAGI